jgi:hypothetical protein
MSAPSQLFQRVLSPLRRLALSASNVYWEARYALGGTSGAGSYGPLARYKADFLNRFVREHEVRSVIEFGCGDGAQLELARYPRYIGLDVSRTIVRKCIERFNGDASRSFFLYNPACYKDSHGLFRADLALSLDVLYHLIEEDVFEHYMQHLFAAADRYVIIYSSDDERRSHAMHVRHRRFSAWVEQHAPGWRLTRRVPNPHADDSAVTGTPYDFFVYEKVMREEPASRARRPAVHRPEFQQHE